MMKRKTNCLYKLLSIVLLAALFVGQAQTDVYAKSLSAKEKRAYRKALESILSNQTTYYYPTFALADVDNDGKKEVIVGYNSEVSGASACACGLLLNDIDGKLVKSEYGGFAGGYRNGYLITGGTTAVGGETTKYYKITAKGKLRLAASETSTDVDGDQYLLNNKETTKKKFNNFIKSKKLNKKAKQLEFRELTQSALDEVFPTKTSSRSAKAKAAFQKYIDKKAYLSDGEDWVTLSEYAFVDLNNDGVTEMLMRETYITDYLYAYVDGKVKFLGQMEHSAYSSGSYYAEKGIIYEYMYQSNRYYWFTGKKLQKKAEYNYGTYYVNGKETTADKYTAAIGELTKNITSSSLDSLDWISLN